MASELIKDVTDLVDALGVKDLVQLGTSLAQRGVDAGSHTIAKKIDEKNSLVEVPELYSSDYRLKVEDAKRWLEEDGLKAEAVIVQPAIEYKDCADQEVVASNFSLGEKVKPGTRIILKYVNAEVIEASQKLFADSEKQKEEAQQRKAETTAKTKESIDKAFTSVQHGLGKVVTAAKEGVGGILSSFSKKEKK